MITCFFENKNKAYLRHVTVDAILVEGAKILLVKRAAGLPCAGKYALPGGYLNRDETLEEGVLREVKEETGYKGEIICLFRINDRPDRKGEDRQNVDFVFIVKAKKKIGNPDKEVEKTVWFDFDNLPKSSDFAFDHFENVMLYVEYRKCGYNKLK